MPFTLNFTDPTKITSVSVPDMPPGINTTDTSLNLIGRGYPNYGQKTAENFLHLLENFANKSAPTNPIQGQLWFDNSTDSLRLKINTTATGQQWAPAGGVWQQPVDPTFTATNLVSPGDLWVNTNHSILNIYTSAGTWQTVGASNPAYGDTFTTSTNILGVAVSGASSYVDTIIVDPILLDPQTGTIAIYQLVIGPGLPPETSVKSVNPNTGWVTLNKKFIGAAATNSIPSELYYFYNPITPSVTTGEFPTLLSDNAGDLHWVIEHRVQDVTVAIDSNDSFYPNPPIANFPFQINTGTTMTTLGKFWGTAQSADGLNLYFGNQTYRLSTNDFFIKDDLTLPGPGQIVTGRSFFQHPEGIVITSQDDPTGASNGKIHLYKSGSELVIRNDVHNSSGNIILATDLLYGGGVKVPSVVQSRSTNTGALTVAGGVGIGGDLWVGGNLHYGKKLVIGIADNIFGGQPGQVLYQQDTTVTKFTNTGTTGTILVSQGGLAPVFTSTSTIQTGYSANLLGGAAGLFAYQSAANTTAFISTSSMTVNTASNAGTLLGGTAGALVYQSATGVTGFITAGTAGQITVSAGTSGVVYVNTTTVQVGYAANLLGGDTNQFAYQSASNATAFISTGSMQVGYSVNLLGGRIGSIPYQTAADATAFLPAAGDAGYVIVSTGANSAPSWKYSSSDNFVNSLVARDANGSSFFNTSTAITVSATSVNAVAAVSTPILEADPTGNPASEGTIIGQWSLGDGSKILGIDPVGLGFGGTTWHAVSRSFGVQYTNSRLYPIMVSASSIAAGGGSNIRSYVDGQQITRWNWQYNGAGAVGGAVFIVPAGSTYQINAEAGADNPPQNWAELY